MGRYFFNIAYRIMNNNIFLKNNDFYKRDLNIKRNLVIQLSFYLHKRSKKDYGTCKKWVIDYISKFDFNKTQVIYYGRDNTTYDRSLRKDFLINYINDVIENHEYLSPSFTSYCNKKVLESPGSKFILYNKRMRSVFKTEKFEAEMAGDTDKAEISDRYQSAKKTSNNSMSGGYTTKGCVLNNPCSHATLTSGTRCATSTGIAVIEKTLGGGRHYFNKDVIIYNIISICSSIDNQNEIKNILSKYNLKIITPNDAMECILRSSNFYLHFTDKQYNEIYTLLCSLNDVELSYFVYNADMWQIRNHNLDFFKTFIYKFINAELSDIPEDIDYVKIIKSAPHSLVNFARCIISEKIKGLFTDYENFDPKILEILGKQVLSITNILEDHKDIIHGLFLSNVLPSSAANIATIIRRVVTRSDTDSVIFSNDEWVEKIYGEYAINEETVAIAAVTSYLSTESTAHGLAMLSSNYGCEGDDRFEIKMKPEISFHVFIESLVAKHYAASNDIQEGNVFKNRKLAIKGVHFINSSLPKALINGTKNKIEEYISTVSSNNKISLIKELEDLINLEKDIENQLLCGNVEFFAKGKVKDKDSYKSSNLISPYVYHTLYDEVFSSKYGKINPPYTTIKIPTTLDSRRLLDEFIMNIPNEIMRDNFSNWIKNHNKKDLPTIYIPIDIVTSGGMIEEIKKCIDIKKIILNITLSRRMTISALGLHLKSGLTATEQILNI